MSLIKKPDRLRTVPKRHTCEFPSGTCEFPSGTCEFPSGSCEFPSGTCEFPSGTCEFPSGTCEFPSGTCESMINYAVVKLYGWGTIADRYDKILRPRFIKRNRKELARIQVTFNEAGPEDLIVSIRNRHDLPIKSCGQIRSVTWSRRLHRVLKCSHS
jgi:hypothetical protein